MANPTKVQAVAELTQHFEQAKATVLTEYRGLTVSEISQLRRNLGQETTYAVVKNTLTKIAAKQAGIDDSLSDMLLGPSAIAFIKGDPVEAAKGLRNFSKDHPALVIKGGVLDGKSLSATEISKLADLESREVLLAKLAGAMNASMSQAAALFQAPLSQMARLAGALQAQASEDPSLLASGAETSAPQGQAQPEAASEPETPSEAPAEEKSE